MAIIRANGVILLCISKYSTKKGLTFFISELVQWSIYFSIGANRYSEKATKITHRNLTIVLLYWYIFVLSAFMSHRNLNV